MCTINFDDLEQWGPWVGDAIVSLAGELLVRDLARADLEYIEDARDWVYERIGRERAAAGLSSALRSCLVRLFHGTRLTDAELEQVSRLGLKPLTLAARKDRVAEILRGHPRWPEVESRLDEAVQAFGPGAQAGLREDGCIHACLSRSGLLLGCNHYLTHGAEVDGHIGYHLFGDNSGSRLFQEHRRPYLISFCVPFDVAAQGSHSLGDLAVGRTLLTDKLIGAWAYGQAHPEFRITTQRDCTAAKIKGGVEPGQLTVTAIDDAQLTDA